MDLDLKKVFERISEIVDVVYITNTESDTYVSLKDNERFREIFGTTGSYRKMMNIFMENTAGKAITDSKQYRNQAASKTDFPRMSRCVLERMNFFIICPTTVWMTRTLLC